MLNDRELNDVLVDLANELDIPPSKYKQAVERYSVVGDWLNDGDYEGVYSDLYVYPQGSFRLGTIIRPLKDGKEADYDIDEDNTKQQLVLNFENPTVTKKLTKIESFNKNLEEFIKSKGFTTNI